MTITIFQYARRCANRYSVEGIRLKGHGHVPRVELGSVDTNFRSLIPSVKVTTTDLGGYYTKRYTLPEILRGFRVDLMAAGIDLDTGEIFQQDLWDAAQAVVKLTGEPYSQSNAWVIASRVMDEREARADRELNDSLLNGSL